MKKEIKYTKEVECCPICGNVCPCCNLGGGACNCCDCVLPNECKTFEEFKERNKYADKDVLLKIWQDYHLCPKTK